MDWIDFKIIMQATLAVALSFWIGCTPPPGTEYIGLQSIRRSGSVYRSKTTSKDLIFSDSGVFTGGGGGNRSTIIQRAKSAIGDPYRYGGSKRGGFDCSGLVLYAYKDSKVALPRSSSAQYSKGKRIPFKQARPGDLVFFKTRGGRISHVGIYLGNYQFVHAPSSGKRVRIDTIKSSYWKRTYAGTVTYL
jgi:cell wall-associated NlpC family hydrolase